MSPCYCELCATELEDGQIGLCDSCQAGERQLPPDPEGLNDERAGYAAVAVEAYVKETRFSPDVSELDEIIGDLLSDLRHFCDRSGVDFEERLDWAQINYQEETRDENS